MSLLPHQIELLAPAKTVEIGKEAILHGADAVYIGGPSFGARHNAGNSVAEIASLCEFAHLYRAKIFVTLNTILHDSELDAARDLIWQLYDAGVDALIIQDMGLLEMDLPPIELHASTQCDIRHANKAKFLSEVGFSQLVLARELNLKQIRSIRDAVPEAVSLEYFVHGALCVAYSGQCYISHAETGRSANRGDCSQACRLPYTLSDEQGRVIAYDKHLLSMKDNNQAQHLEAILDAGVRSLKIEGRYKDVAYVKNITAYYRQLLDQLFETRPEWTAASLGRSDIAFTPNPDKTFHRGSTDYFVEGRKDDVGAFDSPKFVGLPLGEIVKVASDHCQILSAETLHNGDGLNFMKKREVVGFQANTVEKIGQQAEMGLWKVCPHDRAVLADMKPHTSINRNRDHAWEQALLKPSANRKMGIWMDLYETPSGLDLQLSDADGCVVRQTLALELTPANDAVKAAQTIQTQLGKLGQTPFYAESIQLHLSQPWFIAAGQLNQLRREAVEQLIQARQSQYIRGQRRPALEPASNYPEFEINYLANVYNQKAWDFYHKHGVKLIEPAYEAHEEAGEVSLMITKHCLRYSFNLCPKQAKGVKGVMGQVRADPLVLKSGDETYTLKFECAPCEMHVMGSMKKNILKAVPPSDFQYTRPVHFFKSH